MVQGSLSPGSQRGSAPGPKRPDTALGGLSPDDGCESALCLRTLRVCPRVREGRGLCPCMRSGHGRGGPRGAATLGEFVRAEPNGAEPRLA